jgi:hypothetical protein
MTHHRYTEYIGGRPGPWQVEVTDHGGGLVGFVHLNGERQGNRELISEEDFGKRFVLTGLPLVEGVSGVWECGTWMGVV